MTRRWIAARVVVSSLVVGHVSAAQQTSAATPATPRTPREFRIDAGHSSVTFDIPFMYSRVRGRFDEVRGTVILPDGTAGFVRPAAMAVIRVASLNTGSAHRDEHLKSSDFFDAERFPELVFRSAAVTGDAHTFTLAGDLTMHSVTRVVRIPCRVAVNPVHDPHNVVIAEVHGETMLAPRDFGILGGDTHNPWFDKLRSATMGDSVRVVLDVHLWSPDADNPDVATRSNLARFDSLGVDSAIAHLRAAFLRDSSAILGAQPALDAIGQILLARGRTHEGFLWLHALARLMPRSVDAMVSVGLANEALGDTLRASQWYSIARERDSLRTNTRLYVYSRR